MAEAKVGGSAQAKVPSADSEDGKDVDSKPSVQGKCTPANSTIVLLLSPALWLDDDHLSWAG